MMKTESKFNAEVFHAWQNDCVKRLKPNARPASELPRYILERYDLETLDLQDDMLQMFLCSFIPRHFGEQLKHNPPRPSADMSDEELENWQRETDAQREEIHLISPEQFGITVHGFHVLHTDKSKPLIEADRQRWWERWGNDHCKDKKSITEPGGYFCFEETTCEGSGSGFGGTALAREAALFLGVTEEDLQSRTNRFLMYAAALVEEGQLPSLTDYSNK